MLRYGIPAYRLPDAVVEAHVARLEALGVSFRCNTRIGKGGDLTLGRLGAGVATRRSFLPPEPASAAESPLKARNCPACCGAWSSCAPCAAITLLRFRAMSWSWAGGDVAVDAAISAKRLGASSVSMVSLESEAELPAYPHNIADARDEGIDFQCGWGPVRVEGTDAVSGLTVKACLSVKDASGAFRPSFDETQTRTIPADAVIFAIGQAADLDPFAEDVAITPRRTIETAAVTFETSRPDVFAAATRPAARPRPSKPSPEAARRLTRWTVTCAEARSSPTAPPSAKPWTRTGSPAKGYSSPRATSAPLTDAPGFEERRQGLDLHAVLAEGMRCMTCGAKARIAYNDDCMTCFTCELRCPGGSHQRASFQGTAPAYP